MTKRRLSREQQFQQKLQTSRKKPERIEVAPTADEMQQRTACWPVELLIKAGNAIQKGQHVELPIRDEAGTDYEEHDAKTVIEPLDISIDGFRVTANPRPVLADEVARYSSGKCRHCFGTGLIAAKSTVRIGRNNKGKRLTDTLEYKASCRKCADPNYKRQHPNMIIDSRTACWYLLEDLKVETVISEGLTVAQSKNVPDPIA